MYRALYQYRHHTHNPPPGESSCVEQVFGGMRRNTARTYWDADGSPDHLSPRSPLDGDHLLAGGGDSRNWNDDDMFGEHAGGGGASGGGGGGGAGGGAGGPLLPGGMEAGDNASPKGGGVGVGVGGGIGASPREREQSRVAGGAGGHHAGGRKRHRGGRRFFLRIHKFVFQKELALHFSMCILSIAIPFSLSGSPWLAAIPVFVWCFYNAMFVMGAKRAGAVLPGFDRFKRSFVAAMEEFLPPRLVPVLSLSFLSVVIAVTLTAARLGGPPLCFSSCRTCLGSWRNAHPLLIVSGDVPSVSDVIAASSRAGASPKMAGSVNGGSGGSSNRLLGADWQGDFGVGIGFLEQSETAAGAERVLRSKDGQACGYANGKVSIRALDGTRCCVRCRERLWRLIRGHLLKPGRSPVGPYDVVYILCQCVFHYFVMWFCIGCEWRDRTQC